jgi:hypothetical protein
MRSGQDLRVPRALQDLGVGVLNCREGDDGQACLIASSLRGRRRFCAWKERNGEKGRRVEGRGGFEMIRGIRR